MRMFLAMLVVVPLLAQSIDVHAQTLSSHFRDLLQRPETSDRDALFAGDLQRTAGTGIRLSRKASARFSHQLFATVKNPPAADVTAFMTSLLATLRGPSPQSMGWATKRLEAMGAEPQQAEAIAVEMRQLRGN